MDTVFLQLEPQVKDLMEEGFHSRVSEGDLDSLDTQDDASTHRTGAEELHPFSSTVHSRRGELSL